MHSRVANYRGDCAMVRRGGWVLVALIALFAAIPAAHAEVTVSITISGTVEELVPILQKLQELGLGGATASGDPLKLNVHSVMTNEGAAAAAPPAIESAVVEPASAKAGEAVLVTAKIADAGHAIDTVAATVGETKVDLFDNGMEGDATAGDGIWSRRVTLSPALAAGDVAVAVNAYNANGEPVLITGADGQSAPLTAQAKVTVVP